MLDHIKIASENVMVPTTPEKWPVEEISQRMRSKPNSVHSLRRAVYLVFMVWLAAIWIFSSAYEQTSQSGNLKLIILGLDEGAIGVKRLLNMRCALASKILNLIRSR